MKKRIIKNKLFRPDHPFIFSLREESNAFFMGRIVELPKSQAMNLEFEDPSMNDANDVDWSELVEKAKIE